MSEDVGHNGRAGTSDPAPSWMALLASPAAPKRAMSALELDGYLTGVIVAPSPIQASRWTAGLWGEDEPLSDDAAEVRSVLSAIWAMHDALRAKIERSLHKLEADRVCDYHPAFQPTIGKPSHEALRTWASGFWRAMALAPTEWSALAADERLQPVIAPLVGFLDVGDDLEFHPAADINDRLDAAAANIPRAILVLRKIAQLRASRPAARQASGNKPGRNDPCPCGSGKKYKRCCGST